jgi:hypothetical protein
MQTEAPRHPAVHQAPPGPPGWPPVPPIVIAIWSAAGVPAK